MSKTALVLEGGALRTFYTMGVLDALLEANIEFDYVCGVSGGALCAISYLSKQHGRTVRLNQEFLHDKRYRGFSSLLKNKSYFNIGFLMSQAVEAKYPLDYDAYITSDAQFDCVITNTHTGKPEYHAKPTREAFDRIVATASVPYLSKMVPIENHLYLDGGIGDPIPYIRARELGYDRIVVVLTQDESYQKKAPSQADKAITKLFYHEYPHLMDTINSRYQAYNTVRDQLKNDQAHDEVYIIAPSKPVEVSRFETNNQKLKALYDVGYTETMDQVEAIKKYCMQQ